MVRPSGQDRGRAGITGEAQGAEGRMILPARLRARALAAFLLVLDLGGIAFGMSLVRDWRVSYVAGAVAILLADAILAVLW